MTEAITGRSVRIRRGRVAAMTNFLALMASAVILVFMPHDDRVIAAPMFALAAVSLLYFTILWTRDGEVPLFEVGTLLVLSTGVYGILALVGFLQMHGAWDPFSDFRLQAYPFNPSELGRFGWRCVIYLTTFVIIYLAVRRDAAVGRVRMLMPSGATVAAIASLLTALLLFKFFLHIEYGFDAVSYEHLDELAATARRVPYLVQQVGHNLISALLIVQQAVLILLMLLWRHRLSRLVVVVWLVADAAATVAHLGSRTSTMLLILSAALIYHRLVKPISFPTIAIGGALLLAGFVLFGYVRSTVIGEAGAGGALTTMNEFQAIFANAFDLYKRKELGTLPPVPWQIYASDLYMPIPSQLLPFPKLEPGTWYADMLGMSDTGIGLMFGVMAQAVLGLDWLELILRGAALGLLFAFMHRWYVRRAAQLWPTLFYLFLAIWTYYTFRATTFRFAYFVIYQFLPVMAAVKLFELPLKRVLARTTIARSG
jgi:hypothetical protein